MAKIIRRSGWLMTCNCIRKFRQQFQRQKPAETNCQR